MTQYWYSIKICWSSSLLIKQLIFHSTVGVLPVAVQQLVSVVQVGCGSQLQFNLSSEISSPAGLLSSRLSFFGSTSSSCLFIVVINSRLSNLSFLQQIARHKHCHWTCCCWLSLFNTVTLHHCWSSILSFSIASSQLCCLKSGNIVIQHCLIQALLS